MIDKTKSCLVIGAGMAGLVAARTLQEQGVRVTVLDKGRGVGGRMATRRIGAAVFDHGAQFFTARNPRFRALVGGWLKADAAREWCTGFVGPEGFLHSDKHPRYLGVKGMTAVPKFLARGLDIQLGRRITFAEARGRQWTVWTEHGTIFTADALLLTAPVPQSLAILDAGSTALPSQSRSALDAIRYDPCIALMVQPTASRLPAPGGLQLPGEPIAWIGDNRRKGISTAPAVTIHAGGEFSRTHWDCEDVEIASTLLTAASDWLSDPADDVQVHRWRFAKPTALFPGECLAVSEPLPLVFAGDAFGAPRVEGAALSGMAAAQAILESLNVQSCGIR